MGCLRKAKGVKGGGYSELGERKEQNFRRINVGDGEDWKKYILDRNLRDQSAIPHLISFDREAWAADLFQEDFPVFVSALESKLMKNTELGTISCALDVDVIVPVMQLSASTPLTLASSRNIFSSSSSPSSYFSNLLSTDSIISTLFEPVKRPSSKANILSSFLQKRSLLRLSYPFFSENASHSRRSSFPSLRPLNSATYSLHLNSAFTKSILSSNILNKLDTFIFYHIKFYNSCHMPTPYGLCQISNINQLIAMFFFFIDVLLLLKRHNNAVCSVLPITFNHYHI